MRSLRLLPCVLALACSEYDLKSQVDPAGGGPSPDSPPAAPPGGDDTGDTAPKGSRDCQLADDIQFRELAPLSLDDLGGGLGPTDFIASGAMLFTAPEGLLAADAAGNLEVLAPGADAGTGGVHEGWEHHMPTTLADGTVAGWSRYAVDFLDPASGTPVASSPHADASLARMAKGSAADADQTIYWAESNGQSQVSSIIRIDPYNGIRRVVAELGDTYYPWGLEIAPVSGDLYFTHWSSPDSTDIYALARLGPWEWAAPVWAGSVNDRVYDLVVDWCDNLYFVGRSDHIWVMEVGAQEPVPLVPIPPGVRAGQLFWGSGTGDTNPKALYLTAMDLENDLVRRYEIDVDVDGTHVLAR